MSQGTVKVIIGLSGKPLDVPIEMGDTVEMALKKANIPIPNSKDIRVGGQPASLGYQLMVGDQVSFLPKIEGGLQ